MSPNLTVKKRRLVYNPPVHVWVSRGTARLQNIAREFQIFTGRLAHLLVELEMTTTLDATIVHS